MSYLICPIDKDNAVSFVLLQSQIRNFDSEEFFTSSPKMSFCLFKVCLFVI